MYLKIVSLTFVLCSYLNILLAQNAEVNTLQLEAMKVLVPPVDTTASVVYLWAKPLRHRRTPGNKYRVGDWVRLDFSKHPGFRVPTTSKPDGYEYEKLESRFVYDQNPQKQQEYEFYYQGEEGELVSDTMLKTINFSKFPMVVSSLQPYKLSVPNNRGWDLYEVCRWQHPHLYVVAYDSNRKGYYRYRIVLVMYKDIYHPDAYVINE